MRLSIYSLNRGKVSLLLSLTLNLWMNLKIFVNGAVLFIGLGLAAYSQLKNFRLRFNVESVPVESEQKQAQQPQQQQLFEEWSLKPGSVYDGDTLRVVRDNEELKIRFCGIDATEKKMAMGVESRDHLRSLATINNGELLLIPIEKDRYGRTVAEVYVQDSIISGTENNFKS